MCFKIVVCMYFSDGRAERPYFYAVSRKQVAHIKNFVVGELGERFSVNTAELNIGNIQLFQPLSCSSKFGSISSAKAERMKFAIVISPQL